LIRIHSECFTGETIGSMRCDCGEQLDEGIRRISEPQIITSTLPDGTSQSRTIPGRGAVIYLRQEGRGIGLLEKIRAYNVQDLGFDTVSANLILGHGADERGYEIAAAILRDLGLGSGDESEGVRLLTNNPDKVSALQHEGVRIVDRLEMVPRTWICGHENVGPDGQSQHSEEQHYLRRNGATLIGGGVTHGVELERYLRTKVERMGHMLNLPPTPSTPTYSSSASCAISPSRTSRSEELEDADDASSVPSLEADEGSSAAPTRPASATRELVEA
jgi:GTP cyclohydrolase II